MAKEYTYQELETFFDQFKRMPEYITLEKVTQIIRHPSPAFTLPTKGASLRLWTILLSTTAVITISSILYFCSAHNKDSIGEMNPLKNEILPPVAKKPAMTADSVKIELQDEPEQKTKQKAVEKEVASLDTNETNQQLIPQKPKKNQNQEMVAEAIDENTYTIEEAIGGNPYIIDDLTLVEIEKFEVGDTIRIHNILFKAGLSIFQSESYTVLKALLESLKTNKDYNIKILGHINYTSSNPYNLPNRDSRDLDTGEPLSVERAKAVFDYLVNNGIEEARLSYEGLGGVYPIIKEDNMNMRVEIEILKK